MSRQEAGVERRDVPPRGVAIALFWFFFALLASIALVLLAARVIARREVKPPDPGLHFARREMPAPRLQSDPLADRAALEGAARRRIETPGWSDRRRGLVHIPVEAAMRRLAASGWPPEGEARGPEATARAHAEARQ